MRFCPFQLTLGHAKNAATLKFSPKGDDTRDFSELKGCTR